jgi:hypothetical protein
MIAFWIYEHGLTLGFKNHSTLGAQPKACAVAATYIQFNQGPIFSHISGAI